ncbi:Cytokinesis protein sepH [Gracilariopsis chorda]|uniref:Cytokinesis protein sepH n=1 Tax=Gracilariopsis chorda TaxID=448386 RepID=A0A2V3IM42_9FLOR|nr:Cytokinesis protein sepH [Gracilariopsis chorda]|eukprot:PXF43139.1 Cytokinesis protein sepH [Gracilariopsis chorda]
MSSKRHRHGKENDASNLPVPYPRKPPSTNPAHHIRGNARAQYLGQLTLRLRNYLQLAEQKKHALLLLEGRYAEFNQTLEKAKNTGSVPLLRLVATLLARLSVEPKCAAKLTDVAYLPLISAALEVPISDNAQKKNDRLAHDTARLAARAVRNIAAFSPKNAAVIARSSNIIKILINTLQKCTSGVVTDEVIESTAALANFARCGLQFQAYIRKHSALTALAKAAAFQSNPALNFHACRALAEFSLDTRWSVLLIAHGCVKIMLAIIVQQTDYELISEATRFLGNLATAKVGREAVITAQGVEMIVARVVASSHHHTKPEEKHLMIDLIRTTSNLCVDSKDAAGRVIKRGGVLAFIEGYTDQDEQLRTEAFRGLLIVAQGGHGFRASVLREIGVKIRQDASLGRCVAHLYDLSRRIRVEATAERKDDFPQTIAELGNRSKHYLFQAGPLASENESTPNSVPDLKSPPDGAFRQSARILSVQRPVHHRERLARDRKDRPAVHGSSCKRHESHNRSRSPRRHRKTTSSPSDPRQQHQEARNVSDPTPRRRNSEPGDVDDIPRCKVVHNHDKSHGSSNWVAAVWSAVCSAVTRPPNGSPVPAKGSSTGAKLVSASRSDDEDSDDDVYEMGVALGRGGFATVFLAKNLRTGDLVAVKRFHPINSSTAAAKKKAELMARRAMKEQRIWDGLSHKNVVSYRGCFFGETGELNLVAEYIPGWSLADHLSQVGKFPEHMVACITQQIVDGLDYLHKCGVTHRDVKPANILVNPNGVIKITDFGVSSAVDVPTMTGNTLVGTPWYIAPEMIEGRPYGKSVDIWSLGCTVLELSSGRRPYHNLRAHVAMFRMTRDRMPPIPKNLSPKLRDFLKTCWVWDPAQRPSPANLRRHPFLAAVTRPEAIKLKNMARKT